MSKFKPYNSTKRIGKTHIGIKLYFPKEGGYSKNINILDSDIIIYDMLCGINGKEYEIDLEELGNISEDNICFRCMRRYREIKGFGVLFDSNENDMINTPV